MLIEVILQSTNTYSQFNLKMTSKDIGTLISISTLRSSLLLVPSNFEASESHMFKDCKLWLIYWFGSFSLSGLVSYCGVVFWFESPGTFQRISCFWIWT
jgi:hypothetical protein